MEINVLGMLQVRHDGRNATPTATKPRRLLALLALRAGQPVPVPVLIEELWPTAPPRSAHATLHTYVLRVRRQLAMLLPPPDSSKTMLVTHHGGYLLDPSTVSVDVAHYRRLTRLGDQALRRGDAATAARDLREALRWWRGRILADVSAGPELMLEARQLTADRARVLEARIEADLLLGKHQELLGELDVLTTQNPLHERLWSHYMIALYRAGRPKVALHSYHTLHNALVENLGVEPSVRIRMLRRAIVHSDPIPESLLDPRFIRENTRGVL